VPSHQPQALVLYVSVWQYPFQSFGTTTASPDAGGAAIADGATATADINANAAPTTPARPIKRRIHEFENICASCSSTRGRTIAVHRLPLVCMAMTRSRMTL